MLRLFPAECFLCMHADVEPDMLEAEFGAGGRSPGTSGRAGRAGAGPRPAAAPPRQPRGYAGPAPPHQPSGEFAPQSPRHVRGPRPPPQQMLRSPTARDAAAHSRDFGDRYGAEEYAADYSVAQPARPQPPPRPSMVAMSQPVMVQAAPGGAYGIYGSVVMQAPGQIGVLLPRPQGRGPPPPQLQQPMMRGRGRFGPRGRGRMGW